MSLQEEPGNTQVRGSETQPDEPKTNLLERLRDAIRSKPKGEQEKHKPLMSRRGFLNKIIRATLVATAAATATPKPASANRISIPLSLKDANIPENPDVVRERKYKELLERLLEHKAKEIFNPPLYEGADLKEVALDIDHKRIQTQDRVLSHIILLLRSFPEGTEYSDMNLQFLEWLGELIQLYKTISLSESTWDADHGYGRHRLSEHLGWVTSNLVHNDEPPPWENHQLFNHFEGGMMTSVKIMREVYETKEDDSRVLHKANLRKLLTLFQEKSGADTVGAFLIDTQHQTNTIGRMAWNKLVELVLDGYKNQDISVSAARILNDGNFRDEQHFLFGLIADNADASKCQVDWSGYTEDDDAKKYAKPAMESLFRRHFAWQEQMHYEPQEKLEPDSNIDGVPVYGSTTPLNTPELRQLYLDSCGEFGKAGELSSSSEIANKKEQLLKPEVRYIEYLVYKDNYDEFNADLEKFGVSLEKWLAIHVEQLNRMAERSDPPLGIEFKLRRIIIVDESAVRPRKSYPDGVPFGTDKDDDFFINFGFPAVSNVSPWSLDVNARWVISYNLRTFIPTEDSKLFRLSNGELMWIDGAMLHEQVHQLIFMPDDYQSNSNDKPDNWGPDINIPDKFYKHYLASLPDKEHITTCSPIDPTYPWSETIFLHWLIKNNPKALASNWEGLIQRERMRMEWDAWQNKSLNIRLNSSQGYDPTEVSIMPMSKKIGSRVSCDVSSGVAYADGPDVSRKLFGPETSANNMMLSIKNEDGSYWYLPLPKFIISAGYYAADMASSSDVEFDLNLFQEPYTGGNYQDMEHYDAYRVSESEYAELKEAKVDSIVADISMTYQGKKYFFVWCKVGGEATATGESTRKTGPDKRPYYQRGTKDNQGGTQEADNSSERYRP